MSKLDVDVAAINDDMVATWIVSISLRWDQVGNLFWLPTNLTGART
jgi:hypothetical protein